MAEDTKANAEEGAVEAPPKKPIPLGIILVALQLLVVLGGAGVILKGTLLAKKQVLQPKEMQERAIASVRDSLDQVQMVAMDPFTVNTMGKGMMKATLNIEVSNQDTADKMRRRMPAIRARILELLAKQPLSEL